MATCKIMEARAAARRRMTRAVTEGPHLSSLEFSPVRSSRSRRTSDCGIIGKLFSPEVEGLGWSRVVSRV